MITESLVRRTLAELRPGQEVTKDGCFGLLYLEQEHQLTRQKALSQVALAGTDLGIDGFHFDPARRNLYIYQFRFGTSYTPFKVSMQKLIDSGLERLFVAPNKDLAKSQAMLRLRSCLVENRHLIDQILFRFVFTGDPGTADNSRVLEKLREDLENKRYIIDGFFAGRSVSFVTDFRSAGGRVGMTPAPHHSSSFTISMDNVTKVQGPGGETMHMGLVHLMDIQEMHEKLGSRFFHRNIRYGLGESESVNRAISSALRRIVLEGSEPPEVFAFDHNGISLFVSQIEEVPGGCRITDPRMLNGAQTITTLDGFLAKHGGSRKLEEGRKALRAIRVVCKLMSGADDRFVTRVTINNNRQNPVEPWNLRANDIIQLGLQDKLREDLGIYYERQEGAFSQLSEEDLAEYGIKEESRAVQMVKLAQTFLLTDGSISRVAQLKQFFEEDRLYENGFRQGRLKPDSRHIIMCYKVQRKLKMIVEAIEQSGQNKYWFVSRARYLVWALVCQAILNHEKLEELAEAHGTTMTLSNEFSGLLSWIATARVKPMLKNLLEAPEYSEKVRDGNLGFLRSDRAFDKCMQFARDTWGWSHRHLG
ncbi:hypothetical protein GX411_00875 [Candidatus Fermentibacteria bacterium]|nr:hypothetical protein [Candidatus Fermentibacteria bacterium]